MNLLQVNTDLTRLLSLELNGVLLLGLLLQIWCPIGQGRIHPDKSLFMVLYLIIRKAQTNGLSIIPVPDDPFALPSQNSDPIRGPIYVNLDTNCIKEHRNNLFQDFAKESWDQRLFLFRESIVKRFGFVPCTTDPHMQMSSATFSTHHQYIHCTGNCFVLIPTTLDQVSGIQGIKKGIMDKKKEVPIMKEKSEAETQESSSVISRHPEGKTAAKYEHDESGFLWSWNFMISKRWKTISNTGATGDIPFMDKLLADFRQV